VLSTYLLAVAFVSTDCWERVLSAPLWLSRVVPKIASLTFSLARHSRHVIAIIHVIHPCWNLLAAARHFPVTVPWSS
jgi:hypothetical protein